MPRQVIRGIVLVVSALAGSGLVSACTPPMPPDVLAVFAENQITCQAGNVDVSVPEAFAGIMASVGGSLAGTCPDQMVTEVAAGDPAPLSLVAGSPTPQQVSQFSAEYCASGSTVVVPAFAYPVGLVYNAPGLEGLYFTPEAVAGVLSGTITSWEDPAIADANPDYILTDLPPIALMTTDEPQASVQALTTWLSQVAPQAWPTGPSEALEGGQRFATQAEMLTEMGAVPGAIAVAPLSQAVMYGLGAASLPATPSPDDPAGSDRVFVSPDDAQLAKVGAGATSLTVDEATGNLLAAPAVGGVPIPGSFDLAASKVVLGDGQPLAGWPALAYAHLLVCDDPADPLPLSFAQYALRLAGQGSMEAMGVTPLPEPIRVRTFIPLKVTVSTDAPTPASSAAS